MKNVMLTLPDDIFSILRQTPDEFVKQMRLAAAIYWYENGKISQEKAAELAELDRIEFLLVLAREEKDVFQVNIEELKRELNVVQSARD